MFQSSPCVQARHTIQIYSIHCPDPDGIDLRITYVFLGPAVQAHKETAALWRGQELPAVDGLPATVSRCHSQPAACAPCAFDVESRLHGQAVPGRISGPGPDARVQRVAVSRNVVIRRSQPVLDGPPVADHLLGPTVGCAGGALQETHLPGELGRLDKAKPGRVYTLQFGWQVRMPIVFLLCPVIAQPIVEELGTVTFSDLFDVNYGSFLCRSTSADPEA